LLPLLGAQRRGRRETEYRFPHIRRV